VKVAELELLSYAEAEMLFPLAVACSQRAFFYPQPKNFGVDSSGVLWYFSIFKEGQGFILPGSPVDPDSQVVQAYYWSGPPSYKWIFV
jgi:hypothetical protein